MTARDGVKLLAHGVLYAIRPLRLEMTPAPWLALAAAPWMIGPPAPGSRRPARVGFLGYGAGTVASLVRRAGADLELVGVEPDAQVRRLARERMGAGAYGVRIVAADAAGYLRQPGPKFDALLDDVYAPQRGRLARPADCASLPRLAKRRLRRGGVYAANLISPGGAVERATINVTRRAFEHVLVIYTRRYAHKVIVASDAPLPRGALGRALGAILSAAAPRRRLRRLTPGDLGLGPVRRLQACRAGAPGGPARPRAARGSPPSPRRREQVES